MRTIKNILLLALTSMILFTACKDKEEDTPQKRNEYVNNWIYEQMSIYYLWNKQLPGRRGVDFGNNPDAFFKSLLYRKDQNGNDADRFSWIQPDYTALINSLNGVRNDIGFDYIPKLLRDNSKDVGFVVIYTKPNTTASSKMFRGEVIEKVNDVGINTTNYASILNGSASSYKLTIFSPETGASRVVDISTHASYAENPIYYYNIYNKGEKKIGYLVYNFFAQNAGNNDTPSRYDIELMQTLFKFKDERVTDLVLDLRYNPGGSVESALNLASAIVPQRGVNKLFAKNEYNEIVTKEIIKDGEEEMLTEIFRDAFSTKNGVYQIPELNIPKLYVLTSEYSASASELIINGLRPYMEVKIIGKKTYGKNVGSITLFKKDDNRNRWGMQPIVVKSYNSKDESEYTNGFPPQIALDEFDYKLKPLGDENEIMLATAIADVTGSPLPKVKSVSKTKTIEGGASFARKKDAFELNLSDKKVKILQEKFQIK